MRDDQFPNRQDAMLLLTVIMAMTSLLALFEAAILMNGGSPLIWPLIFPATSAGLCIRLLNQSDSY